jgi:hypothetical protein
VALADTLFAILELAPLLGFHVQGHAMQSMVKAIHATEDGLE